MRDLVTSLRLMAVTVVACCVAYTVVVWTIGAVVVPDRASGSLLRDAAGDVIGSRQIAQAFTRPEYVWPRPSAVDYNAASAGGSNLSPLSPRLTERAGTIIARLRPAPGQRVPADLLAASGSGLDPHITRAAARLQAERVATVRGLAVARVEQLIDTLAFSPEGLGLAPPDARIVNVLELNLALDRLRPLGR